MYVSSTFIVMNLLPNNLVALSLLVPGVDGLQCNGDVMFMHWAISFHGVVYPPKR
jgi:hypothetical protein